MMVEPFELKVTREIQRKSKIGATHEKARVKKAELNQE
jgi:hypothetical protein